jgi:hypothetical protein
MVNTIISIISQNFILFILFFIFIIIILKKISPLLLFHVLARPLKEINSR